MIEIKVDLNAPVIKANALSFSFARLSLREKRLIALTISKMDFHSDEFPVIEIHASEYAGIFGTSIESAYGELKGHGVGKDEVKGLVRGLMKRPVEFQEGDDEVIASWVTTARYQPKKGCFKIKFNPDLKTYLLRLKDQFVSYKIRDIYQFKSNNAWSVYEFLRKYKNLKKVEVEFEKFKNEVGCSDLYPRFFDFKKRVLDPAIEEINTTSDIIVQYDKILDKRKLAAIRFHICENTQSAPVHGKGFAAARKQFGQIAVTPKNPEFSARLTQEYGIGSTNAARAAVLWEGREEQAEAILSKIKERWLKGKIKRLGACSYDALVKEASKLLLPIA